MTNSCSEQSHRSRLAAEPVGVGGDDSQGRDEQREKPLLLKPFGQTGGVT